MGKSVEHLPLAYDDLDYFVADDPAARQLFSTR